MAAPHSITSSPSFVARRLQAERWRLLLLAGCLTVLAMVWGLRRLMGGVVASADNIYYPIMGILAGALTVIAWGYFDVLRRERRGGKLPYWPQVAALVFDLAVPFSILWLLSVRSPRGAYAALSGPSLMIVPIVILLSVLKLRPLNSLIAGLGAGLLHAALAYHAIVVEKLDRALYPVVFAYGAFLALLGVAAAVLAYVVRRYIAEAVDEAQTAERASRALAAVENELQIARSIQLGLLPAAAPDFAGFDIAGHAEPASHAGGDYYDWQTLPDGRLVVAIADVTGHGIGPALVMAVCRAYARATAPTSAGASDFLTRLNRLIIGDVTGGRFITMAVALVQRDGAVDLLSAGHGPSFLYRAGTRGVEHFGGDGLPLGVVDGEDYAPIRRLQLEHGDALVLITDGFMEQKSGTDDQQLGIERLAEAIKRHAGGSSRSLIDALYHAARGHAAGAVQGDDMTVVVVKRG